MNGCRIESRRRSRMDGGKMGKGLGGGRGKKRQHNRAEEVQELTDNKEQKGRREVEKTKRDYLEEGGLNMTS